MKPGSGAVARLGDDTPLAALVRRYLEALAVQAYAAETLRTRSHTLALVLDWLAERGVDEAGMVTRAMIARYQRHLHHHRKSTGEPLGVNVQYGRLKAVQLFFGWCVRAGHLEANPAADLDLPRTMKRLPEALTRDEIHRVIAAVDLSEPGGVRDRAALETLYSTGMRRMELAGLRLHDIDQAGAVVRISQGKGRKDRYIPIGRPALRWLERYRQDARPALGPRLGELAVFLNDRGQPIGRDFLTQRIRRYLDAAGIAKKGSCHLFRHTMATQLLEQGCDVRFIQEMLGHAKLDTTAIYTHVSITRLCQAHATFHPEAAEPDEA